MKSDFQFLGERQDWQSFSRGRTDFILKTGIGFDLGIREMLMAAYTLGFTDCHQVKEVIRERS